MGRVRKYKKFKACDPFSKRGGKTVSDTVHDEPPELFDRRVSNSKKRKQHDWDDEAQKELLLQREAMRTLKATTEKETKKEAVKIEPQQDGESLREFKKRVREGTRKTLTEELSKMTSTAKRRKEKLKERKQQKKLKNKKQDYNDQDEVMEFSMAANGTLRPSDLGTSSSSFTKRDSFKFGEQAEKPPELKQFATKIEERKQKLNQKYPSLISNNHSNNNHSDEGSDEEDSRPAKKSKKQKIMDRIDMEGDDGLETVLTSKGKEGIIHAGSHRSSINSNSSNGKGPSTASTKHSNFAEMEAIRNRVQEAYKVLRDKRRAEAATTHTFNSSNRK